MMGLEEHARQVADLLRLLANENRLLLVCALLEGPKVVGELAAVVPGITRPALSQHLHALRGAGLLRDEKRGQFVTYSLADPRLREGLAVLKREYCPEP